MATPAFAEECVYQGTADHSGKLQVTTQTQQKNGELRLRVMLRVQASPLLWKVDYMADEYTVWKGSELQSIAFNDRFLLNGSVKRKKWDTWSKTSGAFRGFRILAENESELQREHRAFSRHWPERMFGQHWWLDHGQSDPDRESALDLPKNAVTKGLQTPLASVFYWIRFLPRKAQKIPVFILTEKEHKRVDFQLPAPKKAGADLVWAAPIHAEKFETPQGKPARITLSSSGLLRQIDLSMRHDLGSASGSLKLVGCK